MIKSKKKTSGWEKLKNQKGKAKKALTLIGSYRKRNANTLAMVSVSAKEGAKYDNIFEAAKEGDTPAVRYMYMDEGKSCKDPDELKGMTPLHWASTGGWHTTVRWLLKQDGVDALAEDFRGFTALDIAKRRGYSLVVGVIDTHLSGAKRGF